ncbi:hypothetical protein L3X38_013872 [Prunus dulcis]|uniref:Uncharacterized protein n=1 Tax=Prunus dulcis TaxID=3755 RepID=A0AAD4WM16_PRUDU|nr:hypothetical protein L3X38_013872 [Prunus dulcis]
MTPTYQSHWEGFMMGMVEYNKQTTSISTNIHSCLHRTHGRCFEKNPTAEWHHKTRSGKLQLIVLLFILFEAGMEWAAGRKLKDSFIFLEASPSSHKPSPPMELLLHGCWSLSLSISSTRH